MKFFFFIFLFSFLPISVFSFCGFYVARGDAALFNESSQVAISRSGDRTVITMASDYTGEISEFSIVIPVPQVITKDRVNIPERPLLEHLDEYSAPRLVEYFDDDPCAPMRPILLRDMAVMSESAPDANFKNSGVKVEASFTKGEYDISVLSAKESDGLTRWLKNNGYNLPAKAGKILNSYIKQGKYFFVAKVNINNFEQQGLVNLRPIQVAFESPLFDLPIRLGTVNSKGSQDMFVYLLSEKGRVEPVNYRLRKVPTNINVPIFVKEEFEAVYPKIFENLVKKNNNSGVFLEYAWNPKSCDPCSAEPPSDETLLELGAFWLLNEKNVFFTRLHVRYDAESFPEDIRFQETSNRENFQVRYVLNHPLKEMPACEAGRKYWTSLPERFQQEAKNLAKLTGDDINTINDKMERGGQKVLPNMKKTEVWWKKFWK